MFYENVPDETNKGKAEPFSIFSASMYLVSTKISEGESCNDCVKFLTTVNFSEKEIIEICMNLDIN